MKPALIAALLGAVFALSACNLFQKKTAAGSPTADQGVVAYDDKPVTNGAPAGGSYPGPVEIGGDTPAAASSGDPSSGLAPGGGAAGQGNIVYFEYDSSSLNAEGQRLVVEYGRYLSENPAAKLRLEGHTDERGTREYNVGLGERRANAVHEGLMRSGASAAQLSVVSYGEERPLSPEQSENGWAQNRRVQIVRQ